MIQRVLSPQPVLVVGAGIMGAGIAQVAAQAGHPVWLFDAREGAAAQAVASLGQTLQGLAAKGKLSAEAAEATFSRLQPLARLEDARGAALVVEAIVEDLQAKRSLLAALEQVVADDAVLATNTSSISVTALANGLKHPQRLVGMHFFNPVPLMKLVEVVSGLHTDCEVAQAIFDLSLAWGKVPVHARSTPGFIVNRIARPFYAETLALLLERAAPPEVLDACLRAAGFRMGPCELMDLIGHDTNFAVTRSVYEANFFDKRYVPSLVQQDMVAGGLLGRKSARGFYRYPEGAPALAAHTAQPLQVPRMLCVHGSGPVARALFDAVHALAVSWEVACTQEPDSPWIGIQIDNGALVLTDGRTATQVARDHGWRDVTVFDRPMRLPVAPGTVLACSHAPGASSQWTSQALNWLSHLGFAPQVLSDTPGLVVARTVAMLINEAADAVLQGVCTPEGADAAMKLGVNYPAGPFEWLQGWDVRGVVSLLESLDTHYRGERYRTSAWLLRA